MKKINFLLLFLGLTIISFSQDTYKKCGQLPHLNPTVKAKCSNDIQKILAEALPASFVKGKTYTSSFKLIIDCNGIIDMVIYKKGDLSTEQQKYFLTQINKLKDWSAGQLNGKDVSTTIYMAIDVSNRQMSYKLF